MFVIRILTALLMAVFMGVGVSAATGFNPYATTGVFVALSLLPNLTPANALGMALTVEIWRKDIVERVFRDNSWMKESVNADEFVENGKTVHIPNAGAQGSAKKNRTDLPATVVKRSDIDVTYSLDEFTTDPVLITDAEKVELSYNKRQSVMGEKYGILSQLAGDEQLYNWGKNSQEIETSGDAVATHLGAYNATGTRAGFTIADVQAAGIKMDEQDVPSNDRNIAVCPQMLKQLKDSLTADEKKAFHAVFDPKTGLIGELEGFKFWKRSKVLFHDGDAFFSANEIPTDQADLSEVVLAWQKDYVESAMGEVKVFEKKNDPQFFGDVMSALLRNGGRSRANDKKGVVTIRQKVLA